jgi:S-DNA-T family DNA segregation ATPase FtsK/SpoIIIE
MFKFRNLRPQTSDNKLAQDTDRVDVIPSDENNSETLEIDPSIPLEVSPEAAQVKVKRISPSWSNFEDVVIGIDDENSRICLNRNSDFNTLISGTSGSGKSTLLRTIVAQYVGNSGPDDMRLIILASSPTEFLQFSLIPHLLTPLSPTTKNYLNVLTWLVREIEKRQTFLAKNNCRDFRSYQEKFGLTEDDDCQEILLVIDDLLFISDDSSAQVFERLSHILIHGRSADIRVLLAVGTWILPAVAETLQFLFNAQIALKVATRRESILAATIDGAQFLASPGEAFVKRADKSEVVKTVLVHKSDVDIAEACNFWPAQGVVAVDQSVNHHESARSVLTNDDRWIDDAMKVIVDMKFCSVSVLQRKMGVSFHRAGLVVALLEERGYVSKDSKRGMLEITQKGLAFNTLS